jgi:hypothetical protein
MGRSSVAFVLCQSVPGELAIERCHEVVSAHLCNDRRSGNRPHPLIPTHEYFLRLACLHLIAAIDQQEIRLPGQIPKGSLHRQQGRPPNVHTIDHAGVDITYPNAHSHPENLLKEHLAHLSGQPFGIIDVLNSPPCGQYDSGGHDGPCECPPPRLIDPGNVRVAPLPQTHFNCPGN